MKVIWRKNEPSCLGEGGVGRYWRRQQWSLLRCHQALFGLGALHISCQLGKGEKDKCCHCLAEFVNSPQNMDMP